MPNTTTATAPIFTVKTRSQIFGIGSDSKTVKGEKQGFSTAILYLAPAKEAGQEDVCPFASEGCRKACLYTAGRGKMPSVVTARIQKTLEFFHDKMAFVDVLIKDVAKHVKKSTKDGVTPCVRLNGTSDIAWEVFAGSNDENVFTSHKDVQFYDYTKSIVRMKKFLKGDLPSNYQLTFSKSEVNEDVCLEVLKAGGNVAVVFKNQPTTWKGFPVIDGDDSDLRFNDGKGVVVGLTAKGDAKNDTTGFVVA